MQHKKDLEIKPSWTTVGLSIVLGDGRKDESSGVTDVVGSQPGASTVSWGTWQGSWCRKATPPVTLHDTFNTLNTSNTSGEGASCISLASRDNSNTTSRMFYVGGSTGMNGKRKSLSHLPRRRLPTKNRLPEGRDIWKYLECGNGWERGSRNEQIKLFPLFLHEKRQGLRPPGFCSISQILPSSIGFGSFTRLL